MFTPIAIIGRACLLPGAHTPDQLWQMVRERRTAISQAPASRWRASRERVLSEGICASDAGGFVEDFGREPGVPESFDPLVHWLIHVARTALQDAGIEPENNERTGAIVGNLAYPTESLVDIAQSLFVPESPVAVDPLNRFSAGLPVHLLCETLGLRAGGFALDAACASSLVAIKLACGWLQTKRADVMLAGAINRVEGLLIHAGFTALRALSPTGSSRPFHRDADGLVPAEGAALLVLKRLEDAEAAGDRILGVIRGVGLSNDGRGSGLLTPSVDGQVRAMKAAYAQSGLDPRDISLIECHATGTSVGDSVELQSMSEVFRGLRDIPIGSLKSNLGHLITASGAAGIIKILEAFRNDVRPATLNASPASNALEGTPFRLLESEEPWEQSGDTPRRAAISSFGFGGNNAHLLLEEYRTSRADGVVQNDLSGTTRRAAIVGFAARLADGESTEAFEADLFGAKTRIRRLPDGTGGARAEEVLLNAAGLIFPPRDLQRTLAQQNLLLAVAGEAFEATTGLDPARTSAFIGMSCDGEITRTVLRAALPDLLSSSNLTELAQRERSMDAGFDAARVVGCMPNIPANRLNRQFGFGGPSFTVAAEELSGIRALDIAIDALAAKEIDAAFVGAADFCVEAVNRSAAEMLHEDRRTPGDGACVLVLKRVEDAIRDGDAIRAIIEMPDDPAATPDENVGHHVRQCFGHVHAASGLLEIAAAAAALGRRIAPDSLGSKLIPLLPVVDRHRSRLRIDAIGGQSAIVDVVQAEKSASLPSWASSVLSVPDILIYASDDLAGLASAVESDRQRPLSDTELPDFRLAIVATESERPERLNQARLFLKREKDAPGTASPEGVFFRRKRLSGDLAFVFTGAAAAYPEMGRDLLLALPQLTRSLNERESDIGRHAGWIYRHPAGFVPNEFERLCGSSFLCQIHTEYSRRVLGLKPQAAIGLSSGETNALCALEAWDGMDDLLRNIETSGLYTTVLGGRADAVHEAWKRSGIEGDRWASYWVSAPFNEVEAAVRTESAVHITIINSANDVVIGGEMTACERVAIRIGMHRVGLLGGEFAAHCPEVEPAADLWRQLHRRLTKQPAGIRFYSNALGRSYDLTADSVADALTAQALHTVDFPRTIRRAWDDGVRIFVEHGPRGQCTQSIRTILGDRPFLAVALDATSRPALRQALCAAADLWTAGIDVDLQGLRTQLGSSRPTPAERQGTLVFPAHPHEPGVLVMAPAPQLAPLTVPQQPGPSAEPEHEPVRVLAQAATARPAPTQVKRTPDVAALHAQMTRAHQEHMVQMARLDQAYQDTQARLLQTMTAGSEPVRTQLVEPRRLRTFTRMELEAHASGLLAEVFGPAFGAQHDFRRRVRMPAPPLLLADRVTSLTGEPDSMALGSITTETDVTADAWYMHHGRMPAGLTIESGQADLMLISWLGVDRLNKGERVYRLLGCDLSFSGALPRAGETLRYDIHVDSHAAHGGVRIFFFHYDCTSGKERRLTVRNGQAGFFTDEELSGSEGILWSAETGSHTSADKARRDQPPQITSRRSFEIADVRAASEGRVVDCFGKGFELSFTHTRTPRIQDGRMRLLQSVPTFDPDGGPWRRGYLRAEWRVRPDDWFFEGHFKNDPCMPGTLMFEGCLQAMAFYLTALGFTLERDGWRFEPVPDEVYSLRCRGQVLPSSRLLVYEVFVDELTGGPTPTLYADVLCTVDGLKAFHCPRLGLRLVADWPLDESQPLASANIPFDYESLMACAWGRPSNAFGPTFSRFDSPIKVPRLPGPPYHFMSRVLRMEESAAAAGTVAEVEYDVPGGAWYFNENGSPVMPVSVLTEVLLQPCGWLASFAGTWKHVRNDIFFRNLDGSGVVHAEVLPSTGTLRTKTTLTSLSEVGAMSITAFKIVCHAGNQLIFEGQAVFGHFPAEALKNQAGLPISDEESRWLLEPSSEGIDLPAFVDPPRLGRDKLRMLDRISGYWPHGGAAGLGRVRAEMDVDPEQWFFKAHFMSDPVQPGSLGLEAVVQTLQAYMIATNRQAGLGNPRFEPIATGEPVSWTYRGQVLPHNHRVTILLEVLEAASGFAKASASLWVDGTKIYWFPGVAMRVVESAASSDSLEVLDPERDTWLRGHCPTYTVPVLPMMSVVDRLAAAAQRAAPGMRVIELRNVTLNGWIAFASGARRLKTDVVRNDSGELEVTLSVWREAPHASLSRYDAMASARVRVAERYPEAPAPMPALANAEQVQIPYESGELFHGPAFQFLQQLLRSNEGSSFLLDSDKGSVPRGFLNQGLLDGMTHGIPNENLRLWSDRIAHDQVGYPSRIARLALFAPTPVSGIGRCEVRFAGFHQDENRFPQFRIQLFDGGKVWLEMDLVYALFDKGPLGNMPGLERRAFLENQQYVPGMELGGVVNGETSVKPSDLYESDWLPGTIDHAFGLKGSNRVRDLAIKQHVAREARVHPAHILVSANGQYAHHRQFPLTRFPVSVTHAGETVRVRDAGPAYLDCGIVRSFWENVQGVKQWPIADLHVGLIERFIRRIEFTDPDGFDAIRGKPAIFLANHQVAIESILFNVVLSALSEVPIKVIAKAEHRHTWIGQLIELTRRYPDLQGPEPILFFDRADPQSLLNLLGEFRGALVKSPASLMVHVDGTRARSCRTPVSQVSSVFLDMSVELDIPIVPVRFTGGLPVKPVAERLEFPFGGGRQDIRVGSPILPRELRLVSLAARSETVVRAINALAPSHEESSGNAAEIQPVSDVLMEALRFASSRCAESDMLLGTLDSASVQWPAGDRGIWLAELKSWLKGVRS